MRIGAIVVVSLIPVASSFAQMPTTDVVVARAEMRDLPNTTTLVGTVEPLMRSLIGSEMAGVVSAMPVRQGDYVQVGALLAQLNGDTIRLELAEAQAVLKGLEARLRQWAFEKVRIERLHGDDQANEKEVYNTRAEHDIARYAVAEQEAIVERLETDFSKTTIVAPFGGYVLRLETEKGQWITKGGAVLEMIDLSSVLVRVDLPEHAIPHVRIGEEARVKIDAVGEAFTGIVRHIIRQADAEARTFPVEIEIENQDHLLAAGMFARVTIVSGPRSRMVAVPKDAIVERDGVRRVARVIPGERGGKAGVLSPVTTGADVDDWVAITSGNVPPGTEVIIRGNERLHPFPSPVRIVDDRGTPVEQASPPPGDMTKGRHG